MYQPRFPLLLTSLDDSGRWGKGGLFSALSSRSTCPQAQYEEAGRMRDLALGDAHVFTMDDIISRDDGRDWVSCLKFNNRPHQMEGGVVSSPKRNIRGGSLGAQAKTLGCAVPHP